MSDSWACDPPCGTQKHMPFCTIPSLNTYKVNFDKCWRDRMGPLCIVICNREVDPACPAGMCSDCHADTCQPEVEMKEAA